MAEDFWGKIFARLHEDIDFLSLVLADSSDADIIAWIKPNRLLSKACARFFHKNSISNRKAIEKVLLQHAASSQALRKMIFFNWVEKNSLAMSIPSKPLTEEVQNEILSGKFGEPDKIRIMSHIDPREGAKPFYQAYIRQLAPIEAAKNDSVDCERRNDNSDVDSDKLSAFENALTEAKADNRILKQELKEKSSQLRNCQAKISQQAENIKALNCESEEYRSLIESLKAKLKYIETSASALRDHPRQVPDIADYRLRIDELESENKKLLQALDNREKSLERLKGELDNFRKIVADNSDNSRTVENLRNMLAEVEKSEQAKSYAAGHLLTRISRGASRRKWMFLSLTGKLYQIPGYLVRQADLVVSELCLIELSCDKTVVAISGLETHQRREVFGSIEIRDNEMFLHTDQECFPVYTPPDENLVGVPVCGVWLPEQNDRQSGIYSIRTFTDDGSHQKLVFQADIKALMKFFDAGKLNFTELCAILQRQKIDFEIVGRELIRFNEDYRQALSRLRMHLKIKNYCENSLCFGEADSATVARLCNHGETCDFCGKVMQSPTEALEALSIPRKVCIFGGDRVGSEFQRLQKYNLAIEWYSGFRNLKELADGISGFDLIVVITRQISHTLVRELVAVCEKNDKDILFCSRRGLTGVLTEIKNRLEP